MSKDSDKVLVELSNAGLIPRSDEDIPEHELDLLEDVRFFDVPDVLDVRVYRESEHYFCLTVRMKSGYNLEWSAPISKIQVYRSTFRGGRRK